MEGMSVILQIFAVI